MSFVQFRCFCQKVFVSVKWKHKYCLTQMLDFSVRCSYIKELQGKHFQCWDGTLRIYSRNGKSHLVEKFTIHVILMHEKHHFNVLFQRFIYSKFPFMSIKGLWEWLKINNRTRMNPKKMNRNVFGWRIETAPI